MALKVFKSFVGNSAMVCFEQSQHCDSATSLTLNYLYFNLNANTSEDIAEIINIVNESPGEDISESDSFELPDFLTNIFCQAEN